MGKIKTSAMIIAPVLLIIILITWGFAKPEKTDNNKETQETDKKQAVAINVKTKKIELTSLSEKIVLSGETLAKINVIYAAEVPGRVEALKADLGQHVKKGAVLARIDHTSLKARRDQAEANYNLAKKSYERLLSLGEENLAPQQQVDEALSGMKQSEAMLKIAKADLGKSVIRATIDGMIAGKFVEVGSFVAPGTPVFKVVDINKIIIEAQVPERQISKVTVGTPVEIFIAATNHKAEAKVSVIVPTAHKISRTFSMRVEIDNPDKKILVGMAAELKIKALEHKQVVVTIFDTVIENDEGRSVFVVENKVARKRMIKLGANDGDLVILSEGVKAGEELIVVGQRELVDGQAVNVISN